MEYVRSFINSLNLPEIANILFFKEECCNDFYIGYFGKNTYVIDDLLDYRESKLETMKISLDEFVELCYNKGERYAFERTFLQVFSESDIELIEKAIAKGKVTLRFLFEDFQKNVNKNILKNVL
ncbi:hypothetical protein PQE75_gp111 [Bacillus phage vB_BcoS-136]|uniref:Uncharacterized protein n=1 Tax=Bacillus phage vB_BcoS-136 TaxID=2419619 RepID=A0A3G3BVT7_9CAUD|nr:hypothetical protein PQE75_gp111 [Bacillus phage vB_BcoS-136]AYP68368.1 hypothetical protein vBBcoS136_00254 [Bacillus phage vB_BcoS-136]